MGGNSTSTKCCVRYVDRLMKRLGHVMSCQWVQWGIVLYRAWPTAIDHAPAYISRDPDTANVQAKWLQHSVVRGAVGITWNSLFILHWDFGGIPTATRTTDNETNRDPTNLRQFRTPNLPVLRPTTRRWIHLRSPTLTRTTSTSTIA